MLSYEILDGFVFVLVWFNCWVHVLILCFLGFAICALCHRSCLYARVVSGHISMTFFSSFVIQSSITACYRFSVFFSTFFFCYLRLYSLLSLSRVFFLLPSWPMSSALLSEVLIADRGVIVYCLLRKSLGCLNWLVYLALPGEVSIG